MSSSVAAPPVLNAITVDVEEHFQVSAFENAVSRDDWPVIPSRVRANTDRLLQLFNDCGVKATFFVLGWVGARYPEIVRSIAEQGHEVASHGFSHRLIYDQKPAEFRDEVLQSKSMLEQVSGQRVRGYRAASFSITRRNLWALDILAEAGFDYDSSLFPVYHDRYGIPGAPRKIYRLRTAAGNTLIEVPPSTVRLGRAVVPVAGGGYLRIFPMRFTLWAIRRLNRSEHMPAIVYVHPWEVDPEQPRIKAPWKSTLRHYSRIDTTQSKLRKLFGRFAFGSMEQMLAREEEPPEWSGFNGRSGGSNG